MAHRVHIVQQTVQGIAVLEDGSSGSHLQSLPLLGVLTYTAAERQASTDIGFARGGLAPRYPAALPPVVPLPPEDAEPDGDGVPDEAAQGEPRLWLTVTTLVAIQLGWGLWLTPYGYARMGWGGATLAIIVLAGLTVYSGIMFGRLRLAVPDAVLFGDIGQAAFGRLGRRICYAAVYSLDATRCIILHLAAAQSLVHASGGALGLWTAGAAVAAAEACLSQVQSLARLGWFLTAGTAAQQCAILLVLVRLLMNRIPDAKHEVFQTRDLSAALVALMNLIFAYGGQFSWVEVMNTMRRPQRFPAAIAACTAAMTCAYLSVGALGYWSQGDNVAQIVLFSIDHDIWARIAACLLLLQATAQYLANINVWALNICTLLQRKDTSSSDSAPQVDVGSAGHSRALWGATTLVVIGYSYLLATILPFFSELVGLVTSVTYLTVAYTLPSAFCLKLLRRKQPRWENALQAVLIPVSIGLSVLGLGSSINKLLGDLREQRHRSDIISASSVIGMVLPATAAC